MNIYVDLDGVLITNTGQVAYYADEFLQALLKKYPNKIHFLSQDSIVVQDKLKTELMPHLEPATITLLDKINFASWKEMKTEAIDFEEDFLWFDDDIWPEELQTLDDNNATHHFVMVDFRKDPNILKKLLVIL